MFGGRAGQGMPRTVKNAKIALLDIDLRKSKMAMGVQVVVTDPKKLEDIRQREADITKERIQMLLNAGANVILQRRASTTWRSSTLWRRTASPCAGARRRT